MTCNLFDHDEYPLLPAVPMRRLPILAQRLDDASPNLGIKNVY